MDVALIGTLLRAGDQVRLRAQLVETPSGTIVWSGNVQLPLQDIFQLQEQLSHTIVEALSIPLSTRERRQMTHDVPASARGRGRPMDPSSATRGLPRSGRFGETDPHA